MISCDPWVGLSAVHPRLDTAKVLHEPIALWRRPPGAGAPAGGGLCAAFCAAWTWARKARRRLCGPPCWPGIWRPPDASSLIASMRPRPMAPKLDGARASASPRTRVAAPGALELRRLMSGLGERPRSFVPPRRTGGRCAGIGRRGGPPGVRQAAAPSVRHLAVPVTS